MSDQVVNTSERNFLDLVLRADPEHYEEEIAYEFSNGRRFKSSDKSDSGVYDNS